MRYVRFLKLPRVVAEKGTSSSQVQLLVTITSDLGDSFLPAGISLSAELLSSQSPEQVFVWKAVQWTDGMRAMSITLPLRKSYAHLPLRVRVGLEPKSSYDDYRKLSSDSSHCGVVSAWSAEFSAQAHAAKLVERHFVLSDGDKVRIWEETGESIARHLWDAGIAFSCHVKDIINEKSNLSKALLPSRSNKSFRVLELGTGCGIVGIAIAQSLQETSVILTDLLDAQEIVQKNIEQATLAKGSSLKFQELNWDDENVLEDLRSPAAPLDLIVAADCTYNPDSSPALVKTLVRLAKVSHNVRVGIAMKMRHSSEEVFFDLMDKASFEKITTFTYPLPGDYELGEETVFLHVFQFRTEL